QDAYLLVEVGDAVVVGVPVEGKLLCRWALPGELQPDVDMVRVAILARLGSKPVDPGLRKLIRVMGIEVIQKNEERPLRRPALRQPDEEVAIDVVGGFSVVGEIPPEEWHCRPELVEIELILEEFRRQEEAVQRAIDESSRVGPGERGEDVVVVDGE